MVTQNEKIFCVLKFQSINMWPLLNEDFRGRCYSFTALSVQPLEIGRLSQPRTLSLAINISKHSVKTLAFYHWKLKILQNNMQMVKCYTMNLAVSQWMYLCKIILTSRIFSTAHSNRKFEKENTKCHWECLFWNKRKKCNKKQSITLTGAEHRMERTQNPNRLKRRNGGGWTQMHCSNECDHVLADWLTSQSASVGCKCLLMYRRSLCN
jgi:hypothetical protein